LRVVLGGQRALLGVPKSFHLCMCVGEKAGGKGGVGDAKGKPGGGGDSFFVPLKASAYRE